MPRVTYASATRRGGFTTGRKRFTRRRASIVSSAKRSKSAGAQSRQIQRLARLAVKNAKILKSTRVYTDYVLRGSVSSPWNSLSWRCYSLMDPTTWLSTMRENTQARYTQTAYIPSIFFQYVAALNDMNQSVAMSMFLVSIKKDASDFVPALSGSNLNDGEEFQAMGNLSMPVLNPGIFKVRWSKTFTLMSNSLVGTSIVPSTTVAAGDPSSTFVRGFINIKIKANLRSPSIFAAPGLVPGYWQQLQDNNLPPSQRLYLMVYFSSGDLVNSPGMYWSLKTTAVTSN